MNYYIQGDPSRAKEIKAAFKKEGITDLSGYNFGNKHALFYTYDCEGRKFIATSCESLHAANIIKTHPDYQELELPVEPKFKVGDWIVQNDNGTVSQITKTINEKDEYGEYRAYEHTNGYFAACFENDYHLWTIADAKDGDVLSIDVNCFQKIVIFKSWSDKGVEGYGITVFKDRVDFPTSYGKKYYSKTWTDTLTPATKEQRDLLFAKMKEAGYQWDADKKELKKIQSHYDIANFHAGMEVLVRDKDNQKWCYLLYSHYDNTYEDGLCFNAGSVDWRQCIPFNEDTKHLLGTTDMPSEEFINW